MELRTWKHPPHGIPVICVGTGRLVVSLNCIPAGVMSVANEKDFVLRRMKMKALKRFLKDEQGTETVEWAIIIGLIAVASITLIVSIGEWVKTKFTTLDTELAKHP